MKSIKRRNRLTSNSNLLAVRLDGKKTKTLSKFYKKIAKRLQFPDYFGFNLDALDECLSDLDWIEQPNVVLYIKNFKNFLNEEEAETRADILDIFERATNEPINEDRGFEVVKVI